MGPCFRRDDDKDSIFIQLINRHCERSEAIHLVCAVRWIASSLALLTMTSRCESAISPRQCARGLPEISLPSKTRARGSRALDAPAASCANVLVSTRVSHHRFTGTTRHSPRNGLRLLRALPGDRACLPPSSANDASTNLTPASGSQNDTTWPSAFATVRYRRYQRPPHPAPRL
jgi:hypothetical protein